MGGQEAGAGALQPGSTPQAASRPATRPARSASDVGHEGGGQALLGLALGAVVEGGPGGGHRRGGVGQVVGHDLVGVDPAVGAARRRSARSTSCSARSTALGGRGQVGG